MQAQWQARTCNDIQREQSWWCISGLNEHAQAIKLVQCKHKRQLDGKSCDEYFDQTRSGRNQTGWSLPQGLWGYVPEYAKDIACPKPPDEMIQSIAKMRSDKSRDKAHEKKRVKEATATATATATRQAHNGE
jgi:hypothetical protein